MGRSVLGSPPAEADRHGRALAFVMPVPAPDPDRDEWIDGSRTDVVSRGPGMANAQAGSGTPPRPCRSVADRRGSDPDVPYPSVRDRAFSLDPRGTFHLLRLCLHGRRIGGRSNHRRRSALFLSYARMPSTMRRPSSGPDEAFVFSHDADPFEHPRATVEHRSRPSRTRVSRSCPSAPRPIPCASLSSPSATVASAS